MSYSRISTKRRVADKVARREDLEWQGELSLEDLIRNSIEEHVLLPELDKEARGAMKTVPLLCCEGKLDHRMRRGTIESMCLKCGMVFTFELV
jgi:hypothetical protein